MDGTILKRLREAQGLSLGSLGLRSGINKSTLSRWESGKTQPRTGELEQVLTILGVSSEERYSLYQSHDAPRATRLLAEAGTVAFGGGELLCALRRRAGKSQEELARFMGVSRTLVGKWEHDRCFPTDSLLERFCQFCRATPEELVGFQTQGWKALRTLPWDREGLDDALENLDLSDPNPHKGLKVLAFASRYQNLHLQGKITAQAATGVYGWHAWQSWYLYNRRSEALEGAAPALRSLLQSEEPLGYTQIATLKVFALSLVRRGQAERAYKVVSACMPRILLPYMQEVHSVLAYLAEAMGQTALVEHHWEDCLTHAQTPQSQVVRRTERAQALTRQRQFVQAVRILPEELPLEQRTPVKIHHALVTAVTLAHLGDKSEASRNLAKAEDLRRQFQLPHIEPGLTRQAIALMA